MGQLRLDGEANYAAFFLGRRLLGLGDEFGAICCDQVDQGHQRKDPSYSKIRRSQM